MKISGKVWKFGDNIDTDMIYPARFMNTADAAEMATHCMEDYDKSFISSIAPGDIIVGGKNYGCGSSREHAPIAIKAVGISCVIAKSFARIFYRNSFNVGLPIIECPEAAEEALQGHKISVDFATGVVVNETLGKTYRTEPFPEFIQKIIAAGGLIRYIDSVKTQG